MGDPLSWGIFAGTAATAIFTGWAIWQRWRYTPRPMWVSPVRGQTTQFALRSQQFAVLSWYVENRGDASAHDVRTWIAPLDGEFVEQRSIAVIAPGGSIGVSFETPMSGSVSYNAGTDGVTDDEKYEWVPQRMRIKWRQHPNLKHEKTREWVLPAPDADRIM